MTSAEAAAQQARYITLDESARVRYECFRDRLREKLGATIHGDVLDVGCMDGRTTASYAPDARSVVGVDIVEHPAWACMSGGNLRYVAADAQRMPFDDASFDVVIAMAMLHHAASPTRVLREMLRVLRAPGRRSERDAYSGEYHHVRDQVHEKPRQ